MERSLILKIIEILTAVMKNSADILIHLFFKGHYSTNKKMTWQKDIEKVAENGNI